MATTELDLSPAPANKACVNYDEFKAAFLRALKDSGLPIMSASLPSEETLDLRTTDRKCTVYVEPVGREIGEPLHVSGTISFRWDALQTARTRSTEEDVLTELLGREDAEGVETERPWIRIDLELRAGLDTGKSIPMPSAKTWEKWSEETFTRLDTIERLVTADVTRETTDGHVAVLAWQGEPEVKATCNLLGELRLESVSLHAFQGIDLPRRWDDPEREADDQPHEQLAAMFKRVKAALNAWGEVMDHLV